MKTQISRTTFDEKKRYSGVYQQQGRMLTDADWNEKVEIEKLRVKSALDKLVAGGSSQRDGFIRYNGDYENPVGQLQWGSIVVDGIDASIVPKTSVENNNFDYLNQLDFPDAPQIAGALSDYNLPAQNNYEIYLDVWERAVNYLEDDDLRDSALQGADTCTRTQIMAQVKLCPSTIDPENLIQNPAKGNATLTLHEREGSTNPDDCDPCSQEVSLVSNGSNYLFRVEVHDATYVGQNIDKLVLKWSSENAAEQYETNNTPIGFKQDTYCYELFSGENEQFKSEKYLGRHFVDNNSGDFPTRGELHFHDAYPEINEDKLIRRWDGSITIKREADNSWSLLEGEDRGTGLSDTLKSYNEHAYVYLDNKFPQKYAEEYLGLDEIELSEETEQQRLIINLNTIVFKLELEDKKFLVGDYWSTAVRNKEEDEFSDEALLLLSKPEGIVHHYYRVASLESGTINWPDSLWDKSAEDLYKSRRLPFNRIDKLQANDIAYTPPQCLPLSNQSVLSLLNKGDNAQWLIKDNREANVKRLLDSLLCLFNASHLPVDRDNASCLLDQENKAGRNTVLSVQDAINNLCIDIQSLTAADIAFEPEACQPSAEKSQSLMTLLATLPPSIQAPETVQNILMTLLCDMDARHIPLYKDSGLCQDLRTDNNIVSVQDAINALCAKDSTSCISYTLEAGTNIQSIFDKVKNGEDANFCFQAGDFELDETAILSNKGRIKITGAGAATKIVVKNNKCAIHIAQCKQLTIRDLSIKSLSLKPLKNGKDNAPTGVLTVSDCEQATIEYLQLKCAAGTRYTSNCLTTRSEKNKHSLRIKSCDLIIGDYQSGILVTNASRAIIEDNTITVSKRPASLKFERIVNDNVTNVHMKREIMDNILVKKSIVEKSDSGKANIVVKLGEYVVSFDSVIKDTSWDAALMANPPERADTKSKEAAETYIKKQITRIAEAPENSSEFFQRINSFLTKGAQTKLTQAQRENLIATSEPIATEDVNEKRSVSLNVDGFIVKFDSTFNTSSWKSIIKKQPIVNKGTQAQVVKYLRDLQLSLLKDSNFRGEIGVVRNWFDNKKENNPTAGSSGIICAGKTAGEIKIFNNNIENVTEAIRVAISNGGFKDNNSSGLQAETVTISNNRMSLSKPATVEIAPRAMMVGNCKHLIVENNRMVAMSMNAEKQIYYEGLRVYGVLGRTILIRQNSLANCITGINLFPLNVASDSWSKNLWKVSDNILPGANVTVIPYGVKDYESNLL